MKIFFNIFIFILLWKFTCSTNINGSSKILKQQTESSVIRTKSLTRLLRYTIKKYFVDCVVLIIHDDQLPHQYPNILKNLTRQSKTTSFYHKRLNVTAKQSFAMSNDKCYHYVIFLNDINVLNNVIAKETVNKVLVVTDSTPWTIKDYLKTTPSRSYINLLIITHSMGTRTGEGAYILYTHMLFTDGSGASQPLLLTSWIRNQTSFPGINFFPQKLTKSFKGHRLVIATAQKPPFTVRTNTMSHDNIDWDGIDIRVLKLITKALNITADFRDPLSSSSPLYAAIMDVMTGKATVAAGGIYKTNNITHQFDTTFSHIEDCAAFISSSSLALPKYRAIMGPFQPGVWIMICIVYFLGIIPLTMNTDYSLLSLIIYPSRFIEMFWFVFGTFTNCFVVKNPLLDSGLAKNSTSVLIGSCPFISLFTLAEIKTLSLKYIILGFYWLFTIIITSCYTGSIMAFITVPQFPHALDTIEQLVDGGFEVGTLDHDGWEEWFNWTKIDDPVAAELLKSLKYVPTVKDGVRNASHSFFWAYTFLGSKIALDYIVQEEFTPSWSTKRSSMHITKECLLNFGVTFVLPKRSIYTNSFNSIIIRARQGGLIQKIIRDVEWDIQRTEEGLRFPISDEYKHRKIIVEDRKLELNDTQGMFLVFVIGILISILAFIIECIVHCCKKKFCYSIETVSIEFDISMPEISDFEVLELSNVDRLNNLRQRFNRSSV